jgi:hypothetical protein
MKKFAALIALACLAAVSAVSLAPAGDSPQTAPARDSALRVTYYYLPG